MTSGIALHNWQTLGVRRTRKLPLDLSALEPLPDSGSSSSFHSGWFQSQACPVGAVVTSLLRAPPHDADKASIRTAAGTTARDAHSPGPCFPEKPQKPREGTISLPPTFYFLEAKKRKNTLDFLQHNHPSDNPKKDYILLFGQEFWRRELRSHLSLEEIKNSMKTKTIIIIIRITDSAFHNHANLIGNELSIQFPGGFGEKAQHDYSFLVRPVCKLIFSDVKDKGISCKTTSKENLKSKASASDL
ncbi:Pericentrin [Manis pentadactyla]|nr:Pericentrin [Manis pentadactyla]